MAAYPGRHVTAESGTKMGARRVSSQLAAARCVRCAAELPAPRPDRRGRPRQYCSATCRSAARRQRDTALSPAAELAAAPESRCQVRLLNVGCTRPADRQIEFRNRVITACTTCAKLAEQWLALNTSAVAAPPGRAPRDTADAPRPPGTLELSRREKEVLVIYAGGAQAKQIARELNLSESTVWQYLRRARQKYESADRAAQTRVDLYARAVEDGLLTPPATTVFADLVETLLEVPNLHEE